MKKLLFALLFFSLVFAVACNNDEDVNDIVNGNDPNPIAVVDLTDIPYNPQQYELEIPDGMPPFPENPANPITVDGVNLGRHLFYDPILSADSSMSCSTCHLPSGNFTDNEAVSVGVDGIAGKRSSMSLMDAAFFNNGLFWDGRIQTLEEQALLPIEDPIELHNTWTKAIMDLQSHPDYPEMFRRAFGIENSSQITKELAAKAIAQFEKTLINTGTSRYDQYRAGNFLALSDSEIRGLLMFIDDGSDDGLPDAECSHCHNPPLFTINEYRNNGLDSVGPDLEHLDNFEDLGLGAVTGIQQDKGKFRIPSLRNIVYSAPYMHDGRFETLEEVVEHYNSGGGLAINKDPLMRPLGLTESQKQDILNFLTALNDEAFMNKPEYQNPFD